MVSQDTVDAVWSLIMNYRAMSREQRIGIMSALIEIKPDELEANIENKYN